MNKEAVILKVQKLLRLGNSSNPNEAANAIAQAQALMAKHNITEMVLSEDKMSEAEHVEHEKIFHFMLHRMGRVTNWRTRLASALAQANNGKVYYTIGDGIKVIGTKNDIQTIEYLYLLICSEIDDLTKRYGSNMGGKYANSFRHGVVSAVAQKLESQKQEIINEVYQEAIRSGLELVLVDRSLDRLRKRDQKVENEYSKLNFKKIQAQTTIQERAYSEGLRHGAKIHISNAKGGLGSGAGKLKG